jgi:hypothetical protein
MGLHAGKEDEADGQVYRVLALFEPFDRFQILPEAIVLIG